MRVKGWPRRHGTKARARSGSLYSSSGWQGGRRECVGKWGMGNGG